MVCTTHLKAGVTDESEAVRAEQATLLVRRGVGGPGIPRDCLGMGAQGLKTVMAAAS